ncbi:hypothetical protein GF340_06205 [Candidatus Peregrinibacteria bacterium]|nr:hypothetical protein [Candidatus Peregrinibacteria bacterium]
MLQNKNTILYNQKSFIFEPARLIYLAGQDFSSIAAQAVERIKTELEQGLDQKLLQEKKSASRATGEILAKIKDIALVEEGKIAEDKEALNNPEKLKYVRQIREARKEAEAKIKENMESYKNKAALVNEITNAEIKTGQYDSIFSQQIEGKNKFEDVPRLREMIHDLKNKKGALSELAAENLNDLKSGMINKIDSMIKLFSDEQKTILEATDKKIVKYDDLIDDMAMEVQGLTMENGEALTDPYAEDKLKKGDMLKLMTHLIYLKGLLVNDDGSLDNAGLKGIVQANITRIESDILENYNSAARDDEQIDLEQIALMDDFTNRVLVNLEKARANYENVANNPQAKKAALQGAKAWLAGAQQAAREKLGYLQQKNIENRSKNIEIDEEGKITFDTDVSDLIEEGLLAIRKGETTVESYDPGTGKNVQIPQIQAVPQISIPESTPIARTGKGKDNELEKTEEGKKA